MPIYLLWLSLVASRYLTCSQSQRNIDWSREGDELEAARQDFVINDFCESIDTARGEKAASLHEKKVSSRIFGYAHFSKSMPETVHGSKASKAPDRDVKPHARNTFWRLRRKLDLIVTETSPQLK